MQLENNAEHTPDVKRSSQCKKYQGFVGGVRDGGQIWISILTKEYVRNAKRKDYESLILFSDTGTAILCNDQWFKVLLQQRMSRNKNRDPKKINCDLPKPTFLYGPEGKPPPSGPLLVDDVLSHCRCHGTGWVQIVTHFLVEEINCICNPDALPPVEFIKKSLFHRLPES